MTCHVVEGKVRDVKYSNTTDTSLSFYGSDVNHLNMILTIATAEDPYEVSVEVYGYLPFKKGQDVRLHYEEKVEKDRFEFLNLDNPIKEKHELHLKLIETDEFSFSF